jgi:ketosteroid isomerase-like protein
MPLSFTPIIQSYVDASNAHDVNSILACFADDAVVRDENATHPGKIEIEHWAQETIDKYKFHLKPLSAERRGTETVVNIESQLKFCRGSHPRLLGKLTSANSVDSVKW